ncbi:hypothetical protein ACP3P8_15960 [Pseudomonas aeruginosa]
MRDLLAHGALGQAQLFGGAGEAQVPGYRFEALQGGHRRQAAFVQHGGFPGAGGAGGTRYMNKRNDVGRKARLLECRATHYCRQVSDSIRWLMTNPSQGFAPNVASLTDMFMSYSNRLFPPSTELREVHVHINFKNRSVLHFH